MFIRDIHTNRTGTIDGYVWADPGLSCPKFTAAVVVWDATDEQPREVESIRISDLNNTDLYSIL